MERRSSGSCPGHGLLLGAHAQLWLSGCPSVSPRPALHSSVAEWKLSQQAQGLQCS